METPEKVEQNPLVSKFPARSVLPYQVTYIRLFVSWCDQQGLSFVNFHPCPCGNMAINMRWW